MRQGSIMTMLLAGTFNFTQGNAAGTQSPLSSSTFPAFKYAPLTFYRVNFTTATTSAARTVSIAGVSLGSISAWPASLAPSAFTFYDILPAGTTTSPLVTANLFSFGVGTGATSTNLVGSYQIYCWGFIL